MLRVPGLGGARATNCRGVLEDQPQGELAKAPFVVVDATDVVGAEAALHCGDRDWATSKVEGGVGTSVVSAIKRNAEEVLRATERV